MSRKKILFVTSRFPWPLDKGDKLRAYHQLKFFSKYADVYLFSVNDMKSPVILPDEIKTICKEITIARLTIFSVLLNLLRSVFSSNPFQVGYFYNQRIKRQFETFADKTKPDFIFAQLIRTAPIVMTRRERKILDYMDVFSKGIERRMRTEPFYLKPLFKCEQRRLVHYEAKVFDWFDASTIISNQDKNLIQHVQRDEIIVVPNGVDLDFFYPAQGIKSFEILFNGNMNYPPNIEAAEYLCKKVLPIVHQKKPNVKVLISGTSPSARVLNLVSNKVVVSGYVPDVRVNFSKCMMLVAPMQSSIGLQNKLLEAMAMGIPCITSTLANNALQAEDGTEIFVADTPEAFAEKIIKLLENKTLSDLLSANGLKFVRKK